MIWLILAIVAGAVWRRWWGDERPSWAFPGFRALQAVVGFGALFGICIAKGIFLPDAAIRAGLALAFLTFCAQSIPHVWAAWDWIDGWLPRGLPKLGRWFTGWTTFSEATAGAVVWAIGVSL
jgi:hypothetical protein